MKRVRFLLVMPWLAANLALAATVSRVDGDVVNVRDISSAQVGDAIEILTRLPGFDEPAKVGSGRVTSVYAGGLTARIDKRSGALAVGQEARLLPPPPISAPPASPVRGLPSPGTPPSSTAPADIERELNAALRQNQFERVIATVGPNRDVVLRGSVTSAADKQRAIQIARQLARTTSVKDQVFIVEP